VNHFSTISNCESYVEGSEFSVRLGAEAKGIPWDATDSTLGDALEVGLNGGFGGQGWRGARRRLAPVVDPGVGCGPARGDPNRP